MVLRHIVYIPFLHRITVLTEKEKLVFLTATVRRMAEDNILYGKSTMAEAETAAKTTLGLLSKELGIRPSEETFQDILRFEEEIEVISEILNKEIRLKE